VVVGSAEGSGVVVRHPSVSAQHARLTYKDGAVHLEDLGSRSGTLAAGALVKKGKPFRILQPMELAFGAVTLKFDFGERPKVLPPSQKRMDAKGRGKAKAGKAAGGSGGLPGKAKAGAVAPAASGAGPSAPPKK
jgi:pSer/pThr/pTyr-binding forkhead associated (FHA) protein